MAPEYVQLIRWGIAALVVIVAILRERKAYDSFGILLIAMIVAVTIATCDGCSCKGC